MCMWGGRLDRRRLLGSNWQRGRVDTAVGCPLLGPDYDDEADGATGDLHDDGLAQLSSLDANVAIEAAHGYAAIKEALKSRLLQIQVRRGGRFCVWCYLEATGARTTLLLVLLVMIKRGGVEGCVLKPRGQSFPPGVNSRKGPPL